MWSFRFLNPSMVDNFPRRVCYHGRDDNEADILCSQLPPNRVRFVGWWYLSPERHLMEWVGFVFVGILILALLGPKIRIIPNKNNPTLQRLLPKSSMKVATLLFYPYVSYTKLSWPGSNYPGRWLLFLGMPVGTLWMLSVLVCFGPWSRCCKSLNKTRGSMNEMPENPTTNTNHSIAPVCDHNTIRCGLLEIWLSFLPTLDGTNLLPQLFTAAVHKFPWDGRFLASGTDGENAYGSYFCHALYVVVVPCLYVLSGEHSLHPPAAKHNMGFVEIYGRLAVECGLRQLLGTAVCVLYYMGVVTPAAIVWGLNVNALLVNPALGPNFRLRKVSEWFCQGWALRCFLGCARDLIGACSARNEEHTDRNKTR